MTKISKRLNSIVSFVNKNDAIVDVGCDHGLLSIYLIENNLVKKVIASDINKNALASAIANVKASELDIECVLSDGIQSVDLNDINTLVTSGMGTSTIIHIFEDTSKLVKINKIITQSNNNHYELRKYLNDIGYYLDDESYTFDKGKWYVTSCFIKSEKTNDERTLKYGLQNNKDYNNYLIDKYKEILKKIPNDSKDRIEVHKELKEIEKAILQ